MSHLDEVVLTARSMNKRMTININSTMFPKLLQKNFDENEKKE
jgi:hypothetical protein